MAHRTVHVTLPDEWEEVPDERRVFRRKGKYGGLLRLNLLPPQEHLVGADDATLIAFMLSTLESLEMDFGERQVVECYDCTLGRLAFSLWRTPSAGVVAIWIIPCELLITGIYTMGSPPWGLATFLRDVNEARDIMWEVEIRDRDDEG